MQHKRTKNILILAFSMLVISCSKEPGFGGLSTISGKVWATDITPNSQIIQDEGYTANIKVVIAVENSGMILDEVRTDLNGSYKFEELRKGVYQIWTFTDCDSCRNNEAPIIQRVEIKQRKEEIALPDFKIII